MVLILCSKLTIDNSYSFLYPLMFHLIIFVGGEESIINLVYFYIFGMLSIQSHLVLPPTHRSNDGISAKDLFCLVVLANYYQVATSLKAWYLPSPRELVHSLGDLLLSCLSVCSLFRPVSNVSIRTRT